MEIYHVMNEQNDHDGVKKTFRCTIFLSLSLSLSLDISIVCMVAHATTYVDQDQ